MRLVINGRMLFRHITGVERYAWETISAMDRIIEKDEIALIIPDNVDDSSLNLSNFQIIRLKGPQNPFLWEQLTLLKYAKLNDLTVLNFDFSTPLLHAGISVIHDVSFNAFKSYFQKTINGNIIRFKLNLYCKALKRSRNIVGTLTYFQKQEIVKYFKISEEKIIVTGCGWEHILRTAEDASIIKEQKLEPYNYYMALGSNTENKNFKWIYEVAKRNRNSQFVIVGGDTSISKGQLNNMDNLRCLGYLTDERVIALYKRCKAFLFPSIYEGFGIPPLEALALGAPIIVSNSSCLPEIYNEGAAFFEPYDYDVDLEKLVSEAKEKDSKKILSVYTWENVAKKWVHLIRDAVAKTEV